MENKIIKSGTEFMTVIGSIIIILGVIGAIGILVSFDWETWNDIKDLTYSYADEIALLKPAHDAVYINAFTALIGCGAIGAFFIAVDKIGYTLKKIQLGIKDDGQKLYKETQTDEDEGYGSL